MAELRGVTVREERIAEKSAARDEWRRLYDMVGKLLFDHGLEPSPANFELCHRYLAGRDRELNSMVDRAIAKDGGLSEAVAAAISAKLDSGLSTDELSRIADDAQDYLEQMSTILSRSCRVSIFICSPTGKIVFPYCRRKKSRTIFMRASQR